MAHATRGRSPFRIARAAFSALLLAGAPHCTDFFAWPAPGYSTERRPHSTTRWATETTEPATESQAEEPRPSDHRVRELRSRVAALRAQMVQQRREINELTKELLKEELLCATRSPEQNGFDRLFRSVGVLIHTAWKNGDPVSFVYNQTGTAIRVAGQTAASGELIRDVLPNAPTLLTVAPGLYAHASRLDRHLPQILSVLDGYLPMVEPHLEVLIERFDDIEPHLDFCLKHADVVVPRLNEVVEHLDDILFFARERSLWQKLEPLLPQLAARLDKLGPHLPAIRRHAEYVTPILPVLAVHADRLIEHRPISEHADALVRFLGWALKVPGFHYVLDLPGVGRALSWLAPRLPRRRASAASWEIPEKAAASVPPGKQEKAMLAPAAVHVLLALRLAAQNQATSMPLPQK